MDKGYEQNKIIARYVGKEYQRSKQRMAIMEYAENGKRNSKQYKDDAAYVYAIDRVLNDCQRSTRNIIMHEYLTSEDDTNWYLDYYSRTTYYRMKKKAVEEFVHCLNI